MLWLPAPIEQAIKLQVLVEEITLAVRSSTRPAHHPRPRKESALKTQLKRIHLDSLEGKLKDLGVGARYNGFLLQFTHLSVFGSCHFMRTIPAAFWEREREGERHGSKMLQTQGTFIRFGMLCWMQVKSEVDLGFVDGDTIRKLSLTPVQVRKTKLT